MEFNGGSLEADHLCVLVHGLWGNPNHMRSIAKALRAAYPEERLYILVAERNKGSFTYDGIELGGERVCVEIEEELEKIRSRGGKVAKLSIVGYSLGGLVARYAVGLLHAKGVFDQVEPVNFTTFVTPHLGVRSPSRGWHNHVWNVLGARTLSMSGRQLFTIDNFRGTGRPLLAILADPDSIFMSGLKRFKRRTLYTNIVNDRSAVYYTTGISKTEPFTDMSKVKANYLEGYEDVILDPRNPVSPLVPKESTRLRLASATEMCLSLFKKWPLVVALVIFIPVGFAAFLVNALVQTFRSSRRIKLHEQGLAGIQVQNYRVPIWIKEIRGAVEDAYENLNSSQDQSYLRSSDDEGDYSDMDREETEILALERKQSHPSLPTLALAPYQFAMISALDNLGWRKYPVWIHKHMHSHAAIIVQDAIIDIDTAAATTSRKRKRITKVTTTALTTPTSVTKPEGRARTAKTEEEEVELRSPSRKHKQQRKPARKTVDPATGAARVSPPSDWEAVYAAVKAMRTAPGGVAANAAVDTMGCERLAAADASPRDRRFHTLVALMLSSQTKDTTNAVAMRRLQTELPAHEPGAPPGLNLENMLAVDPDVLNGLIWAVGFHNNKTRYLKQAAVILRDKWGGDIPDTIEGLVSLPGVGPKMAYLCLSAAWDRTEGIGVDVHVHRITNLWSWHSTKNPEETRAALESWLPRDRWREINWLLVGFGQTVCLPVGRRCGECELGLDGLCRAAERKKVVEGRKAREAKIEAKGDGDLVVKVKEEDEEAEKDVVVNEPR
ncbi:hypothetical protein DL766_006171 [Monosporascus sp. MC13-8B]|nr:hypothetical protein DL763_003778 [Monosporascus cannonballus]RYP27864.1 hypothetical protein DL766_006171 [Monosporascus sp. MC13-8B]